MQDIWKLIRVLNFLLHCPDRVPLCLSPLRSEWSLWLSANFPYMAYFATVVTPGGPEWALGGLVVLLSAPVTIIHDLPLNFAHVFLQLKQKWKCNLLAVEVNQMLLVFVPRHPSALLASNFYPPVVMQCAHLGHCSCSQQHSIFGVK